MNINYICINPITLVKYIVISIFFTFCSIKTYCQTGKSLVFNGCTDFLEIAESDLLDYNEALSIEAWIAPNCDDANRVIVGKEWCVGEMSYYLSVFNGKLFWRFSESGACTSGTSSLQTVNNVIPSETFTHVAVVHGQSEVKLFINGIEAATEYVEGSFRQIYNGNQEFRIGAYKNIGGSFGSYFSGLIDALRVWSIALTEAMIQSNMTTTLNGNENGLILNIDMESVDSGPDITLINQANVSENLTAYSAGFTSSTPYFIEYEDYNINPLNFEDQYHICNDVLNITLGINNYKSILWSTGSQSNSTTISNSGTYSVTIETELCKFFSQSIQVTITDEVNIEEDVYICSEDIYEYQGQFLVPNTSTEFILPGMLGCDTSLTINVFGLPNQEGSFLGNDTVSCRSTVSLISPYENTTWNDDFVGSEFTVDEEGVYIAVATDELGCTIKDTIAVAFELPFEQISVAICKDDFYEFEGDLLPSNTSATYTIENAHGCDSIVLIHVLEVPQLASPFLGQDITSCQYPLTLQSPYPNTLWNDDIVGSELSVTEEGVYYAVATDHLGCSYIDTISVTFEIPSEDIIVEICKDDVYPFEGEILQVNTSSTFVIDGSDGCDSIVLIHVLEISPQELPFLGDDIHSCRDTFILQSPYENTLWDDVFIGSEFQVTEEGVYHAVATDELGCTFYDSIFVDFDELFVQISVAICKDDFYEFNGDLLPVNSSTTFTIESANGCDSTILIHVLEVLQLEASFLGDDIISCQESFILQSPYENTIWNDDFTGSEILITEEGIYHALATDELGCSFIDSISVVFEIPFKEISVEICKDDFYPFNGDLLQVNSSATYVVNSADGCDSTVLIHVTELPQQETSFLGDDLIVCSELVSILSPYENTSWSGGSIGSELEVEEAGIYFAQATDTLGCSYFDSISVAFEILTKEMSVTVCKDELFLFNGDLLSPSTSYEYNIESATGCDTVLTVNVLELESPDIFEINAMSICQNEIVLSSPFDSTIWNSDLISKNFKVEKSGYHFAEAYDNNNCLVKDTIWIEFLNPNVYLPNVISKKSNLNNCFKPIFSDAKSHNYSLMIFDRWGNLIFSKAGNDVEWCGYYKNKFVESGVYAYVLELEEAYNATNRKIGTLSVI